MSPLHRTTSNTSQEFSSQPAAMPHSLRWYGAETKANGDAEDSTPLPFKPE
jgi:hypothetical protein